MSKVIVLGDVHRSTVDYLNQHGYEGVYAETTESEIFLKHLPQAEGIIYRLFSTHFSTVILQKAASLRCIVRTGGGASQMDQKIVRSRDIKVMHTAGCNSETAAEFIFSSVLSMSKRISQGNMVFRSGKYDRSKLWGNRVGEKTLGIIGFGRMGKALSRMARSFGMRVVSYSPNLTEEVAGEYRVDAMSLDELYQASDFISIAFPARSEFKGMFDRKAFAKMKDGVCLVNMTWMGLFDEGALVEALDGGKIGNIMIERPSFDPSEGHPLMEFENVIFGPALGSHSVEGQSHCGSLAADLVMNYLKLGEVDNEVKLS